MAPVWCFLATIGDSKFPIRPSVHLVSWMQWCMMQSRNRIDVDRPRGGSCPMSGKVDAEQARIISECLNTAHMVQWAPNHFWGGLLLPQIWIYMDLQIMVGLNFPNGVAISKNRVIYGKCALQPKHSAIVLCHSRLSYLSYDRAYGPATLLQQIYCYWFNVIWCYGHCSVDCSNYTVSELFS